MATLDTLIKLSQKKLEDCQMRLTSLEMELGALAAMEAELKKETQQSYDVASAVTTMAGYQDAGAFLARAEHEQQEIDARRTVLNGEKEELLAQLRVLFAEKKRFEVLLETQQKRDKKKREKKEQATLEDLTNR